MVALEPGAALLLASRGIVEAKRKGEEFGLQRVKDTLQKSNGEGAREICVSVLDQMKQFMGTVPTHNDVTALVLARDS
jgi:serine phosphatase RsbU (regulator of sigma subunit)